MSDYFKSSTLSTVRHITREEKGEEFAIALVNILLDHVWSKDDFLTVIEEQTTINADVNDNDEEHARGYEREIRKGL